MKAEEVVQVGEASGKAKKGQLHALGCCLGLWEKPGRSKKWGQRELTSVGIFLV